MKARDSTASSTTPAHPAVAPSSDPSMGREKVILLKVILVGCCVLLGLCIVRRHHVHALATQRRAARYLRAKAKLGMRRHARFALKREFATRKVQATYRMHVRRRAYKNYKTCANKIQAFARMLVPRTRFLDRLRARRALAAVRILQPWTRGTLVRLRVRRALAAVRVLQPWTRGAMVRIRARRALAAVLVLQPWARGSLARLQARRALAVRLLQQWARDSIVRLRARRALAAVRVLQQWARDSIARQRSRIALAAVRVFLQWARAAVAADADQDDNVSVADCSGDTEESTDAPADDQYDDEASVDSSVNQVDDGSDSSLEAPPVNAAIAPGGAQQDPPRVIHRVRHYNPSGVAKNKYGKHFAFIRFDGKSREVSSAYDHQYTAVFALRIAEEKLLESPNLTYQEVRVHTDAEMSNAEYSE
jgi:hypothetical protein